ncbi:unnamed protein product [Lupinus luteus]|uniref:Stigma-specific STIG1-like protein 1 n=1 Tax=Lupinus luteus TaxID=3873 RepID=A0AAV1WD33_LUPLU
MKTLLLVVMLMALVAITLSATSSEPNGFVSQRYGRVVATSCDKYPKICDVKGSAGSDCCNNKCVKLSTDGSNCGKCGKKCSYGKICCEAMPRK